MVKLNNKARITLVSFMSYFVMSLIVSPIGVISTGIAEHYDISLTHAIALFSYLTTGVFVGCFFSMFVFTRFGAKMVMFVSNIVLLVLMVFLKFLDQSETLAMVFSIIGVCSGLLLSGAAIILTHIYSEKFRPSALLATDSFYSLAGVISTFVAGAAAAKYFHWSSTYNIVILACLLICVLIGTSRFPDMKIQQVVEKKKPQNRWPIGVFIIAVALVIYITCFAFIYTWIPNYATETFNANSLQSSALVGKMFMGMFAGQLAMFFLALRVNITTLLFLCGLGAFLATIGICMAPNMNLLSLSMLLLGLSSGGLLKMLVSYGTVFSLNPTARMVGFLMFSMTLGSAVAPALSAWIVEKKDVVSVLNWASVGYGLMVILVIWSFCVKPKQRQ